VPNGNTTVPPETAGAAPPASKAGAGADGSSQRMRPTSVLIAQARLSRLTT
jgi:hypothetical protein